jgi:hypothetical protein
MSSTLGPIEMLVIGFPENQFKGEIVPEITDLVNRGVISVVNGILIRKEPDGSTNVSNFDEVGLTAGNVTEFGADVESAVNDLFSDDQVAAIAAELDPNSSVGVLIFENTWVKGLQSAISGAGGVMMRNVRVDGPTLEEIIAGLRG